MIHDELVRFAAGKVGGEVDDGDVMIRSIIEIGDGHVCPVNNFYQLTSPELMLKGLEVCSCDVSLTYGSASHEKMVCFMEGTRHEVWKLYKKAEDIPLTFWQCWAQLSEEKTNEK